ncbi:MAG: hypothetical protein ACOY0R_05055 [Chloroflexota bacterium]
MSDKVQEFFDKYGSTLAIFALGTVLMCCGFAFSIYVLGCLPGQICVSAP